jgi:hypothetical protein
VVTVTSVDTLRNAVAIAERKVQQDQSRVDQDADRLDQSRVQLGKDREQLNGKQKETRQAEAATEAAPTPVRLDRAITVQVEVPASLQISPRQPQVNAQGQTVGRLIHIVA